MRSRGNGTRPRRRGCFVRIAILAVLAIAIGISFIWAPQINHALGLRGVEEDVFGGDYTANDIINMGDGDSRMVIHFVDVGQADSQLILTPSGQRIIIDAGTGIGPSSGWLMSYIYENFDSQYMYDRQFGFDYAILTHAHEDHMGEFYHVLERYGARVFYRPNVLATRRGFTDPGASMLRRDYQGRLQEQSTLIYSEVLRRVHNPRLVEEVRIISPSLPVAHKSITPIGYPETITRDDSNFYELVFYTPLRYFYSNQNDFSPIKILRYQGRQIVLTGDAELIGERDFVDRANNPVGRPTKFERFLEPNFTVCVIALGHHGSRTSSHDFFLDFLTTAESRPNVIAIISAGQNNRHGHPHGQVLNRLDEMGFSEENILRTDIHGTIVMTIVPDATNPVFGRLYVGGSVHRIEDATVSVVLTWIPLSITLWVIVALFVMLPVFARRRGRSPRSPRTPRAPRQPRNNNNRSNNIRNNNSFSRPSNSSRNTNSSRNNSNNRNSNNNRNNNNNSRW